MAYNADKKPGELTALTSLATDDLIIVGDTSDVSEVAKSITKANLEADLVPAVATTVTTNANLTGHVTSTGNAAVLGSFTKAQLDTAVSDDNILYDSELTSIADVKALDQSVVSGAAPVLDATNFTNLPSGTPEGTAVLSTGEVGGTKFLREDGDGTSSWNVIPAASTTVAGIAEIATDAEMTTGTATDRVITPANAKVELDKKSLLAGSSSIVTVGTVTSGNVDAVVSAASTTTAGKVELTTDAEYTTGTDTTRATTAANAKVELDKKLALAGGTMTGDILLGTGTGDKSSIILNDSALADESWSGTTVKGTAGATLAVGDLCYLKTSDSEWYLTDGILDGTDVSVGMMLGVCVLASTDGVATEILIDGLIASAAFPAFTVGAPVYMSDTAGDMVVAQPSTTNFAIRVLGYATSATVLHFRPSFDYIVHV